MNVEPSVSVVIPSFERRRLVIEAVWSALAQTHGDLEVIVVDDGSTDGTAAAVGAIDGRVKVVRRRHGGPAAARNTGIRQARAPDPRLPGFRRSVAPAPSRGDSGTARLAPRGGPGMHRRSDPRRRFPETPGRAPGRGARRPARRPPVYVRGWGEARGGRGRWRLRRATPGARGLRPLVPPLSRGFVRARQRRYVGGGRTAGQVAGGGSSGRALSRCIRTLGRPVRAAGVRDSRAPSGRGEQAAGRGRPRSGRGGPRDGGARCGRSGTARRPSSYRHGGSFRNWPTTAIGLCGGSYARIHAGTNRRSASGLWPG